MSGEKIDWSELLDATHDVGVDVREVPYDELPPFIKAIVDRAVETKEDTRSPLEQALDLMMVANKTTNLALAQAGEARAEILALEFDLRKRKAAVLKKLVDGGEWGRNADEREINAEFALMTDDALRHLESELVDKRQAVERATAVYDAMHSAEKMLLHSIRARLDHDANAVEAAKVVDEAGGSAPDLDAEDWKTIRSALMTQATYEDSNDNTSGADNCDRITDKITDFLDDWDEWTK